VPKSTIGDARYYGYAVTGPEPQGPFEWHSFDQDKALLDPYAKTVYFPPSFERAAAIGPGTNAGKAPLGLLTTDGTLFDWSDDVRPWHEADAIIYELHVRGFTTNPNSGVSPERRGTFAGLVEKVAYLKELGVTVVELMPVFQCDPQEGSHRGYMPLNFFAPRAGYASKSDGNGPCEEFRSLVRSFARSRHRSRARRGLQPHRRR
jgi:isoamylase